MIPPPFTMSQSQWKAYFSMFVLGQTNMIENPSMSLTDDWQHQSAPWAAIVMNFKSNHSISDDNIYNANDYCHCCGYPSDAYYCGHCEADRCAGCGEIGCGSYMCRPCRQMEQY